jgi:hypothetical protein
MKARCRRRSLTAVRTSRTFWLSPSLTCTTTESSTSVRKDKLARCIVIDENNNLRSKNRIGSQENLNEQKKLTLLQKMINRPSLSGFRVVEQALLVCYPKIWAPNVRQDWKGGCINRLNSAISSLWYLKPSIIQFKSSRI